MVRAPVSFERDPGSDSRALSRASAHRSAYAAFSSASQPSCGTTGYTGGARTASVGTAGKVRLRLSKLALVLAAPHGHVWPVFPDRRRSPGLTLWLPHPLIQNPQVPGQSGRAVCLDRLRSCEQPLQEAWRLFPLASSADASLRACRV